MNGDLGEGAGGTGVRIATASVRTGFAMTHYKECGRRADVGIGPYGYIIVSAVEVRAG